MAGPSGGTTAKSVGTVCFAWARIDNAGLRSDAECHHFGGDREAVRRQTVAVALKGLMES